MTAKNDMTGSILYADSLRGVHIPQYFAQTVDLDALYGYDRDDLNALFIGPTDDNAADYWAAWDNILNSAYITDAATQTDYRIVHDDDLWLVPVDQDLFFAMAH